MSDIDNCFKFKCKECGVNTFCIYVKTWVNARLKMKHCEECFKEKIKLFKNRDVI